MHFFTDVTIRGIKGEKHLKRVLVDTGATFTTMPPTVVDRVGAIGFPKFIDLTLGDGRTVKATLHSAEVEINGKRGFVNIASFENALPVIGMDTIRTLGLSRKDWVEDVYKVKYGIVGFNPLEKFLLRITLAGLKVFMWCALSAAFLLIVGIVILLVIWGWLLLT